MTSEPGEAARRDYPLDLSQARRVYASDVAFRRLVDVLEVAIESLQMTPAEIRAAAVFACYRVEARKPPPPMLVPAEWWESHPLRDEVRRA